MSENNSEDLHNILPPAFRALDNLRVAIDASEEAGNDEITAALIWAVCDMVDTIDLVNALLKKDNSAQTKSSRFDDIDDCIELVVR